MAHMTSLRVQLDSARAEQAGLRARHTELLDRYTRRSRDSRLQLWDEIRRVSLALEAATSDENQIGIEIRMTLASLRAIDSLMDVLCGAPDAGRAGGATSASGDAGSSGSASGSGEPPVIAPPSGPRGRELEPAPQLNGKWGDTGGTIYTVTGGTFSVGKVVRATVSIDGRATSKKGLPGHGVRGKLFDKKGNPSADYRGVLFRRKNGQWYLEGEYRYYTPGSDWLGWNYSERPKGE